jgi:hypothetical protein
MAVTRPIPRDPPVISAVFGMRGGVYRAETTECAAVESKILFAFSAEERCMKLSVPVAVTLLAGVLLAGSASGAGPPAAAAAAAAGRDWPLGLGKLDSLPRRYPPAEANAGALRLTVLAFPLEVDFERVWTARSAQRDRLISDYIEAQLVRSDDHVDVPPPELADFLRDHERQLNAVTDLLLSAPVLWPMHIERGARAPLPNLRAHLRLTRLLVSRALVRSSWNDLRAASALQRALWTRPEMLSQLIAMSSTRIILAAARKLPAPVPSWSGELMRFDVQRSVIAAMQWEAWLVRQELQGSGDARSVRDRLEDIIMKPFDHVVAGDYDELLRRAAIDLEKSRQCAFDGEAFDRRMGSQMPFWDVVTHLASPNLGAAWQRVARLTAERELTERILSMRSGRAPELSSSCADGAWTLTRDASGARHLRFSRDIPVHKPQLAIPLEQVVP